MKTEGWTFSRTFQNIALEDVTARGFLKAQIHFFVSFLYRELGLVPTGIALYC
jgi:hypothetical protein